MKWLSRKLAIVVMGGLVLIIRPEIALYATILGCVGIIAFAYVDGKKK